MEQLDAVAERVMDIEAAHPGIAVIPLDVHTRGGTSRADRFDVVDPQRRMRLPSWPKVSINAQVELRTPDAEPYAAGGLERFGLRNLLQTKNADVESTSENLGLWRNGDLYVVEREKVHNLVRWCGIRNRLDLRIRTQRSAGRRAGLDSQGPIRPVGPWQGVISGRLIAEDAPADNPRPTAAVASGIPAAATPPAMQAFAIR